MRIYISGKITGTTDYEERFAMAEQKLRGIGYEVVNPVRRTAYLVGKHKTLKLPPPQWSDYMRECLLAISVCDTIYMLKGWKESRGSRLEHHIAEELDMEIIYEE